MKLTFLLILLLSISSCKSNKKKHSLKEKTNKIGIKTFKVDDKNIKDSIVEYIKIDGDEYANQIWLINESNDTIGGNYFNSYIKDTIKLGEITRLRFVLTKPTIDWNSEMFVLLPYDDDELNSDFSNLREIKLDTFHSLKNDGIPHPELNGLDFPLNHITEFGLDFANSGKKRIRGIVVERGEKYNQKYERRLFFDESIYIQE